MGPDDATHPGPVTAPAPPRPHTRARTQLLLGLAPLLLVCAVLVAVLVVRLAAAQAPLEAASELATATVDETGLAPDGRGVSVQIPDGGETRRGVLVFRQPVAAASGAEVSVQYDPDSPAGDTAVYADGDAAHRAVQDIVFGLAVVAFVALLALVLTALRLHSRTRLRRRPAVRATSTRVVVRTGLLVRSWLELGTASGVRWLPVYWSPELAALPEGAAVELRGDPARDRLVLPIVDGAEVWPSGRLRAGTPRGERRTAAPEADAPRVGWGRQVRSDVLLALAAPLLGLVWAYLDDSGPAGFAVASVLAAAVIFWLTELLGSDPAPPDR
jgi:hypothetical protein